MLFGQEQKLLPALAKAQSEQSARTDGEQALPDLIALIAHPLFVERVEPDVDSARVVGDDAGRKGVDHQQHQRKAETDPVVADAADIHHHSTDAEQQHHTGKVRLLRHQRRNHAEDGTAFAQDGVLLYVPKNVAVEKPIQLVNILRGDVNFMVNRRVLIILEEGAQARLLACDHAMDSVNFLATQVVEVFVGENATFDFYELEETHTSTVRISSLYVRQEANSNVLLNGMTLHNGTTRNTTEVTLAGEGAELNLCGMAVADKNQHVDNNTTIDHAVPNCTSNELFKYVLDDQSVGAFAGLVLVRPGAQHTSSQQTNRNLCATREAHMYTQPQLEIYADDVKCSHGATVGQLDESALFYMQQRGISVHEARLLLMFAFVNEVIDTIRLDALKDRLHLLVEKRFRGELNKCRGCAICK